MVTARPPLVSLSLFFFYGAICLPRVASPRSFVSSQSAAPLRFDGGSQNTWTVFPQTANATCARARSCSRDLAISSSQLAKGQVKIFGLCAKIPEGTLHAFASRTRECRDRSMRRVAANFLKRKLNNKEKFASSDMRPNVPRQ